MTEDNPDTLEQRIKALEKHAHPPVTFVECSECHAVVFEESWDNHLVWHNREDDE